jgi:hypothetical protein
MIVLRKFPAEQPSKNFLEDRLDKRPLAQGGSKSGIAKSLFKSVTHFLKFPLKNLKQSEANKEFLRTAQTAVFKQHADLRENAEMGKSPITPGLITIQPSPYFTAMAELSAISFQQDLTTVSDDWGAHVHDTGQYISILMFHHASRLHQSN